MAVFEVTDPDTGQVLELEGDSPPTEAELEEIFRSFSQSPSDQISEVSTAVGGEVSQEELLGPRAGFETRKGVNELEPPTFFDTIKSVGNELLAESPILATATAGALAGGAVGGPPGAVVGAIGGGAVGVLAKEGVEQLLLRAGLIEEGDVLVSDIPIKKKSLQEVSDETIQTGLAMGVGEGAGRLITAPFSKFARGASKSVSPEGRESLEFFKARPGSGVVLNPAKVTDSRFLDVASNAGEASILSGDKFLKGQIKVSEFIDDSINQLVNKPGISKETLGNILESSVNKRVDAFTGAAGTLFKRIDDVAGGEFVNAAPIIRQAQKFIGQVKSTVKSKPVLGILEDVEKIGKTFVDKNANLSRGMTFSEAQQLRSALLQIERQGGDALPERTIGFVKSLESTLERQMESTASKLGPDVLGQFRKANAFWKQGKNTFNDSIIKSVLTKDPDLAIDRILSATKDRAVLIRRIKSAVGNKEAIQQLEDAALKRIIFKATNSQTGELTSKTILNQLKIFGGVDGKALRAMFPKGQDKVLSRLARIKGVVMQGQPDATGRLAVQIGQLTALAGLATGTFPVGSATVLIAPEIIARAFSNPRIVRFITQGAKARPGIKGGVNFISRFAAILSKENIPFELQKQENK